MNNQQLNGEVEELDVDIQGLRITGKWPNIKILMQDTTGEWIELGYVYKLTLVLDANEIPKVQIERYVGINSRQPTEPTNERA